MNGGCRGAGTGGRSLKYKQKGERSPQGDGKEESWREEGNRERGKHGCPGLGDSPLTI